MTDEQQAQMEALEPAFIQVQLEAVSEHALQTGNKEGYETDEYFQARVRYLELRTSNKQKAATNYGGGGVTEGGNGSGHS